MTFFQAIILGIVQGLTEFLPVSSSAHLVLVPYWLNWAIPESQIFPFDVLVQLGTLAAVIVYFWKDLWQIIQGFLTAMADRDPWGNPGARLGWFLVLATIPAGFLGLLLKPLVEQAFNSPAVTGGFLILTAALLVCAEVTGKQNRSLEKMTWKDALIIGMGQAVSIFPGISRSGATISAGVIRHFERLAAARFSFLLSIPIMLAAGILEGKDLVTDPNLYELLPLILVGFLTAALVGYASIHWLLKILSRFSLTWFGLYCLLAGVLTLVIGWYR